MKGGRGEKIRVVKAKMTVNIKTCGEEKVEVIVTTVRARKVDIVMELKEIWCLVFNGDGDGVVNSLAWW